jgi:alpha-maltose-1-phosphate synthase
MKVTISVPGKFPPAYQWAHYLESRGELERLVTMLPYSRGKAFGVSRRRTLALSAFGVWSHIFQPKVPVRTQPQTQLAMSIAFDLLASRVLGDVDVVNSWASVALTSIRRAKKRGIPVVLQTGSAHVRWQTEAVNGEASRLGIDWPRTAESLIRRTEAEYAEADAIVVPSRFAARTFIEQGVPARKVAIVPWAVRPVVREHYERPARETVTILFVGALSVRKGVAHLVDVFRRLPGHARLRLVGPPSPALVDALAPLPRHAQVVGPLRGGALAREFHDADIFVMPSIEDGSACATMEAMAAGLPVVVSDAAGADLVHHGTSGFVFSAGDAGALCERLSMLIDDRELRLQVGAQGAAAVSSRTGDDYGAQLVADVYEPLLAKRRL